MTDDGQMTFHFASQNGPFEAVKLLLDIRGDTYDAGWHQIQMDCSSFCVRRILLNGRLRNGTWMSMQRLIVDSQLYILLQEIRGCVKYLLDDGIR